MMSLSEFNKLKSISSVIYNDSEEILKKLRHDLHASNKNNDILFKEYNRMCSVNHEKRILKKCICCNSYIKICNTARFLRFYHDKNEGHVCELIAVCDLCLSNEIEKRHSWKSAYNSLSREFKLTRFCHGNHRFGLDDILYTDDCYSATLSYYDNDRCKINSISKNPLIRMKNEKAIRNVSAYIIQTAFRNNYDFFKALNYNDEDDEV